jgi:hypothetical protein
MATLGEALVAKMKTMVGRPYVFGGASPSGFDCSGLVSWGASALGIKGLPRTSQAMRNIGTAVPLSQIGIGDLVTFTYADRRGDNPGPGNHVAVYAGSGQVVQASGTRVNVGPLDTTHIDRVIRLPQIAKGGVIQAGVSDIVTSVLGGGPQVVTAQQAGYSAKSRVGDYGAPVNPFKMPGFIASGSAAAAESPGGVVQASDSSGNPFSSGATPWDGISTMVLAAAFVLGGLVLVVAGAAAAFKGGDE